MSASALRTARTAAMLAALIGIAVTAALAWSAYANPVMGLMLDAFRFCG